MTIHDSLKSDTRCRMGHRSAKWPQNQWVPCQFDLPAFFATLAFKTRFRVECELLYVKVHCGTMSAILQCIWGAAVNYQANQLYLMSNDLIRCFMFGAPHFHIHSWCSSSRSALVAKLNSLQQQRYDFLHVPRPKRCLANLTRMSGFWSISEASNSCVSLWKPRIGVLPIYPADVGKLPGYFRLFQK